MKKIFFLMLALIGTIAVNSAYSLPSFWYSGIAYTSAGAVKVTGTVNLSVDVAGTGSTFAAVPVDAFGVFSIQVPLNGVTLSAATKIKITVTGDESGSLTPYVIVNQTLAPSYFNQYVAPGSIDATDLSLADGKILIGGTDGRAHEFALSGDVTMTNAGVTAIGTDKVLTGMIKDGEILPGDLNVTQTTSPWVFAANVDANAGLDVTGGLTVATGNTTITPIAATTIDELITIGIDGVLKSVTALPDGTTATTQAAGDNSTKVATTAFVAAAANALTLQNAYDNTQWFDGEDTPYLETAEERALATLYGVGKFIDATGAQVKIVRSRDGENMGTALSVNASNPKNGFGALSSSIKNMTYTELTTQGNTFMAYEGKLDEGTSGWIGMAGVASQLQTGAGAAGILKAGLAGIARLTNDVPGAFGAIGATFGGLDYAGFFSGDVALVGATSDLSVAGMSSLNGGIVVGANLFNVAAADGDASTAGTFNAALGLSSGAYLTVTGNTTLTGTFGFDGGQAVSEIVTTIGPATGLGAALHTNLPTELAVREAIGAASGALTLDAAYINGNTITTSATDGDVIIGGTEALAVTAVGGVEVTNNLQANELLLNSGHFRVAEDGADIPWVNIIKGTSAVLEIGLGTDGTAAPAGYGIQVNDDAGATRAGIGFEGGNWVAGVKGTGAGNYSAGAMSTGDNAMLAVLSGTTPVFSANQAGDVASATVTTTGAATVGGTATVTGAATLNSTLTMGLTNATTLVALTGATTSTITYTLGGFVDASSEFPSVAVNGTVLNLINTSTNALIITGLIGDQITINVGEMGSFLKTSGGWVTVQ